MILLGHIGPTLHGKKHKTRHDEAGGYSMEGPHVKQGKLNPLTEASWDLRDLKSSYWMNDAEWKKIFLRTPEKNNR